jgi:hypothetical protein
MYTEFSSTEGSAGRSLNTAPGNEKFSHPPQMKTAQLSWNFFTINHRELPDIVMKIATGVLILKTT